MKSDRRVAGRDRRRRGFGDDPRRAARAARHASALIDGSGRMGRGVAYSTTEPAHLLNVRAEGMSAWAGEPDHFARAFEAEGGDRRGFAQRRFFGALSGRAPGRGGGRRPHRVGRRDGRSAPRADGDGWRVELDDGSSIEARRACARHRQPGAGRLARFCRAPASASSAIRGATTRAPRVARSRARPAERRCSSAPA